MKNQNSNQNSNQNQGVNEMKMLRVSYDDCNEMCCGVVSDVSEVFIEDELMSGDVIKGDVGCVFMYGSGEEWLIDLNEMLKRGEMYVNEKGCIEKKESSWSWLYSDVGSFKYDDKMYVVSVVWCKNGDGKRVMVVNVDLI